MLLLPLLLLFFLLSPSVPAVAAFDIPYTTVGPYPSNGGYGFYALSLYYNESMFPFDPQLPTVDFALSVTGAAAFTQALEFMVDITNFRGGVVIDGVRHYVTVTFTEDGGSDVLAQYVYADMFASQRFAMYFAPDTNALLSAVSALLPGSNATMMSVDNVDPAAYSSHYPNLFTLIDTADSTWTASLQAINARAQQYAAEGGDGSLNGIRTICMFTVDTDPLLTAAFVGVRSWIESENARRLYADNITVLVDLVWAENNTGTYLDYAAVLPLCPDDTDLMILQQSATQGLDAALALQASQLRPKAVMGLNEENCPQVLDLLYQPYFGLVTSGWVIPLPVSLESASIAERGGIFQSVFDLESASYVWQTAVNVSVEQEINFAYWSVFGVMCAALTNATSLQPAALRQAFLNLNGQTSTVAPILFDNETGINVAPADILIQVNASGYIYYDAALSESFQYPYEWSWRLPGPGDSLSNSQTNAPALLSAVICVLGAWVALIIVEQSIFIRRTAGGWRYALWLMVVACSLGGAAVWCSLLMSATALGLTLRGQELHTSYSLSVAFLSLLPAIVLTWSGLLVLMGDVRGAASTGSADDLPTKAQEALRLQAERKKKKAALSNSEHLRHLVRCLSWRVLLGGLLVQAAIVLTRVTLWYVWLQQAGWTTLGLLPLPLAINVVLVPLAMLMFFHALRWRILAVFLFAACVIQDWQLSLQSLSWHYEPGPSSAYFHGLSVDSTVVQLIAGLEAAALCFVFIGLQFSRMRLSRNELTVLVASLESVVGRLKDGHQQDAYAIDQQRRQLTRLARMLEFVTLNTPLPTEYAFALASAASYATFQSALTGGAANVSAAVSGFSSPSGSQQQQLMAKAAATRRSTTLKGPTGSSLRPMSVSNIAVPGGIEDDNLVLYDSRDEKPAQAGSPVLRSTGSPNAGVGETPALSSTGSDFPLKAAGQPSDPTAVLLASAPAFPATSEEADSALEEMALQRKKSSLMLLDAAEDQLTTVHAQQLSLSPRPPSRSHKFAPLEVEVATSTALAPAVAKAMDRRWKAYEEEVCALLEQYSGWRQQSQTALTTPSPYKKGHKLAGRQSSSSMAGEVSDGFELSMPLLGLSRGRTLAAAMTQPQLANPSLLSLLSHPVCVELIKSELQLIRSVENVVCYLHIQRYRRMMQPRLRKLLAAHIHSHFIRDGAAQQVNIATRQRDAIGAAVLHRSSDSCGLELFRDVERELLLLIETNVMKAIQGTPTQRLCSWVLASMPTSDLTDCLAGTEGEEDRAEYAGTFSVKEESSSASPSRPQRSQHSASHG